MILATCRNLGGLNQVLPATKELRRRGYGVVIATNGRVVAESLSAQMEPFIFADSPLFILDAVRNVNLFFTSTCFGGIGRKLITDASLGCPKIVLQDFWGAGVFTDWREVRYRPDYICVNDQVDSEITQKAWPEFDKSKIKVTGYSAFDKYILVDVKSQQELVFSKLGLDSRKKMVLFAGHAYGTVGALFELVKVLNDVQAGIYLVVRFHPRMTEHEGGDKEKLDCLDILTDFRGGDLVKDTTMFDSPTVLSAADVVISMYSTMLVEAAVLRKPNISSLYPDKGMR